jgi:glycosyltransferase involved in cell wall biosynthesis
MSILDMQFRRLQQSHARHLIQRLRLDKVPLIFERAARRLRSEDPKVFYRYAHSVRVVHPAFRVNFSHPPLRYSTRGQAQLYHWWHSPDEWWDAQQDSDPIPYVIEPIDHAFSVARVWEPSAGIASTERCRAYYADPRCRRIAVLSHGQLELFRHYFPEFEDKYVVVPQGTLPVRTEPRPPSDRPHFLCVASDYRKKGVDLVIDAWIKASPSTARLTIVCPDVPEERGRAAAGAGVEIVTSNPPLSDAALASLYETADVAIVSHHAEALNAYLEAVAHALPIISMRGQHGGDFVADGAGIECDVPLYFYDTDGYGIRWQTWDGFFEQVAEAKASGAFDHAIDEMARAILALEEPDVRRDMSERSAARAAGWFHIDNRNEILRSVYRASLQGDTP